MVIPAHLLDRLPARALARLLDRLRTLRCALAWATEAPATLAHELGHALVARRHGVRVRVLSVGVGRLLATARVGGVRVEVRRDASGGQVRYCNRFRRLAPAARVRVALAGPAAEMAFGCALVAVGCVLAVGVVAGALPGWAAFASAAGSLVARRAFLGAFRSLVVNRHPRYWSDGATVVEGMAALGLPPPPLARCSRG